MNIGSKSNSNNLQGSLSSNLKSNTKQNDLTNKCSECGRVTNSNQKSEDNNQWSSVPMTYNKEESTKKHEKSETDNQWTSTSK